MQTLIDLLLLLAGLSGIYLGLGLLAVVMEKGMRVSTHLGRAGRGGEAA